MPIAVVVEFVVKDEKLSRFREMVVENAHESINEAGCIQFDVCEDDGLILLYELYEDSAAFQYHLSAPHFLDFSAATADMLISKTVKTLGVHQARKTV